MISAPAKVMGLLLLFSCLPLCPASSQDISQIAQSDPLIITGAIGTNNTYYHSSFGDGYRSPLSNTFYMNLNISLYGISMPFSLYYSNDNLDFNYPEISFNLNPRYKNWTGYIGMSSMNFSSYVMSMSFNGVGVEYDDNKHWRFGAFYGTLRKAINDNPADPNARQPQYKRVGFGFKVGYGIGPNYIDLYFLRAYDRLKSLDDYWQQRLSPQENITVALKGAVRPLPWLSFQGNIATSLFSTDTRAEKIEDSSYDKWGRVFETRYSSLARFAGDISATFSLRGKLNASLIYRMVQPDYTSLGAYYISNNYQSFGLNLSAVPMRNLSMTGTFSVQSDNLSGKQLYTTRGYVYSLNASTRVAKLVNIAASYNGYTQKQYDGAASVNEATRVNRVMQSFTLTPSISFDSEQLGHSVSLSTCYTTNKDHNKSSNGQSDVTSFALGLNYAVNVRPWETDLMCSLNRQQSNGYNSTYISNIASFTASRSFLKEKNLNLSATANFIYNELRRQSKSLSIGADLTVGYTLKKVHVFSLGASVSKYGDVNMSKQRSSLDNTEITASLNYAYTFSLLQIKKKAKKESKK